MSGNGSDSSEDEWVTSTVIEPAKSKTKTTTTSFFRSNSNYNHIPTTTSSAIFATSTASISTSTTSSSSTSTINISRTATPTAKRLAVSDATIRTIKANLPKSSTQKAQDQAAYITPQDLEQFCQTADSPSFIQKLVETYKSAETYLRIREIETSKLTIDVRLSECLQECPDPGAFVLQLIYDLAVYCKQNPGEGRTLKFQRYLVQALCRAFDTFIHTPPMKYKVPKKLQEKDLISFAEEPNLILFDDDDDADDEANLLNTNDYSEDEDGDVDDEEEDEDDDDDDDDSDSDDSDLGDGVATISLAELLDIPPEAAARYAMTREHQEACVRLLDRIPTPILVYYAMDVFKLRELVGRDCDLEDDGVKMCNLLMRDGHYNEAISCIRKLNLFEAFPIDKFAAKLFAANQGNILPVFTSGNATLQKLLLEYINIQLRYTFAGNLDIVPTEYLASIPDDEKSAPPLPRLRERRIQKDLTSCATRIMQELNIDDTEHYFIWLSQKYAALRYLIKQRAAQQHDECDMSIAASSNYNGLIELIIRDDPAVVKLAIKEFVDMNDAVAATHFAHVFGQHQFLVEYNGLPLGDRSVGMLKGEVPSSRYHGSPRRSPVANPIYYQLPNQVRPVMVDNHHKVMQLKATLAQTRICGLDTEWVPQFARSGTIKTALMQIASDRGVVYLVDIAKALHPMNIALLQDMDLVLRMLFEEKQIIKLAYDFNGDFSLLKECMPTASDWYTANLVDFKSLRTKHGEPIPGGLAGVVSTFLGVSMNKKQQLSNWEQRPLTVDQATYAASDAYCLIEIYGNLVNDNHPFIKTIDHGTDNRHYKSLASSAPTTTAMPLSTPSPPIPSLSVERDLVQF